jgi:hypothetical protein
LDSITQYDMTINVSPPMRRQGRAGRKEGGRC